MEKAIPHTQGPWHFDGQKIIATSVEKENGSGEFGAIVAKIDRWPGYSAECEGNGHLMAAAPKMLEALCAAAIALQGPISDESRRSVHAAVVDATKAAKNIQENFQERA